MGDCTRDLRDFLDESFGEITGDLIMVLTDLEWVTGLFEGCFFARIGFMRWVFAFSDLRDWLLFRVDERDFFGTDFRLA